MNSPVVKRKAKPVKQSEKENEEVTGSTINTKSPRKQPRQSQNNNKTNAASPVRAQKSRDFTVDIFTSKSSEAKQEVDVKEVEETKKAAAAEDKVGIFFNWHWLTFLGRIFQ